MGIMHRKGRFYMRTEHGEAELLYEIDKNTMSIFHTFVPDEDRRKGFAERLAFAAFDFAKRNNLKVKPDCPYIEHFLDMHREMREHTVK
jgi:hypothetical protein